MIPRIITATVCCTLLAGAAFAQGNTGGNSTTCSVTRLRFLFTTGNDDLRGGRDNLNIVIYLDGANSQLALNVNKNANWPNYSVKTVDVALDQPVSPSRINGFRLIHIADGGFNWNSLLSLPTPAAPFEIPQAFQSQDNWNMSLLEVSALGEGVGARIATHPFHRFTGSDPMLFVKADIPPNVCGSGRPTGNSNNKEATVNSGTSALRSPVQPPASELSPSAHARKPLTNADVASMVKQGVPPSVVVSAIQSSPGNFDLSAAKLAELQKASVGQTVIAAMREAATGNSGAPASSSNPRNPGSSTEAVSDYHQPVRQAPFRWTISEALVQALRRDAQTAREAGAGAKPSGVSGVAPHTPQNSMAIAAAARGITDGTFSASKTSLNGGDKTMSASGAQGNTSAAIAGAHTLQLKQAAPILGQGSPAGNANSGVVRQPATALCGPNGWGIGAVDGFTQESLAFGPQAEWNPYRIAGCGFGDKPGQVWVTGVKYQPVTTAGSGGARPATFSPHPDWVLLQLYKSHWSNEDIDVVVDPNASGFLPTDNVTLLVITANGQQYQKAGYSFVPLYEEKRITSIPQNLLAPVLGASGSPTTVKLSSGVDALAQVHDANGHPVTSYIFSPSDGTLVLPGHTLGVVREDNSAPFPGGTDAFDFTDLLFITQAPLSHADLTASSCSTGNLSTNGDWLFSWTASPVRFTVSWQEQSCSIGSGTSSVSAYAVDLYGWVPRGTSPW